jgi:hypothetical protein
MLRSFLSVGPACPFCLLFLKPNAGSVTNKSNVNITYLGTTFLDFERVVRFLSILNENHTSTFGLIADPSALQAEIHPLDGHNT